MAESSCAGWVIPSWRIMRSPLAVPSSWRRTRSCKGKRLSSASPRFGRAPAGALARLDRRIRLGPRHPVHPGATRQAVRAHRMVLLQPARRDFGRRLSLSPKAASTTTSFSPSSATRPARPSPSPRPACCSSAGRFQAKARLFASSRGGRSTRFAAMRWPPRPPRKRAISPSPRW